MKNERTTWTSPKTNMIAAANDLRGCLASGHKARLIRIFNEDCMHPILLDKNELSKDFKEYEFSIGTLRTKAEIIADTSMSEFEKTLSLEYHACFGNADAVDKYYPFPSTAHSSSRPSHDSSIRALRSYWNASARAASRSAGRFTLLIPIEEPSAFGLTNTG